MQLPVYTFNEDSSYFLVKMAFEAYAVQNEIHLKRVSEREIVAIDLVYTLFPMNKDFIELNRNRLKELLRLYPEIANKKNIQWRWIAQTEAQNRAEANRMFHGWVIYYRPEKQITSEIKEIIIPNDEPDEDLDDFGEVLGYKKKGSATLLFEDLKPQATLGADKGIVYTVLDKHLNRWNSIGLVMDWTASMYEFGWYLPDWLKKNNEKAKNIQSFVLFNDGNGKKEGEKVIGQTGGIYFTHSREVRDWFKLMMECSNNDTGENDWQENPVEALLYAQIICPDCKDLVLVADARSPARDFSLLDALIHQCRLKQQRIHVILCGANEMLQAEYIYLAVATKGTLHTLEEDVDISALGENQEFQLNGKQWIFQNGQLRRLKKK